MSIEKISRGDEGYMMAFAEEQVSVLKRKLNEGHGTFSETVEILPDGQIKHIDAKHKTIVSSFAQEFAEKGTEGLYRYAQEIEKISPDIHFKFEVDPEGKWVRYTVTEDQQK